MVLLLLFQWVAAIEVTELSIEYKQVGAGSVIYELPQDRRPSAEFNLNLDLAVFGTVYMRNQVHSFICQPVFCLVGWKFEVGAYVHPSVQIYIQHFSQHEMDGIPRMHFPVYDSVGVRVRFI